MNPQAGQQNDDMTPLEALTLALYLSLTAPDDHKAAQAAELAEQIARGMQPADVEKAQRRALIRYKDN